MNMCLAMHGRAKNSRRVSKVLIYKRRGGHYRGEECVMSEILRTQKIAKFDAEANELYYQKAPSIFHGSTRFESELRTLCLFQTVQSVFGERAYLELRCSTESTTMLERGRQVVFKAPKFF